MRSPNSSFSTKRSHFHWNHLQFEQFSAHKPGNKYQNPLYNLTSYELEKKVACLLFGCYSCLTSLLNNCLLLYLDYNRQFLLSISIRVTKRTESLHYSQKKSSNTTWIWSLLRIDDTRTTRTSKSSYIWSKIVLTSICCQSFHQKT